MSIKYYLAVDIGASSGRHILGHVEDGRIVTEEVYRFWNGMEELDGHKVWDMERLFSEVLAGMKACRDAGKIPVSMGIDTWGVDYVLLGKDDRIVGKTYAYRDERTNGAEKIVYGKIAEEALYKRTGIQKASFNTIFQLAAAREQEPETLECAESLLMVPDYLNFRLTGVKKQEYTNATTTGLVNAKTKEWDTDLIECLGLPKKLFGKLSVPGDTVGRLTEVVQREVGFDCTVRLPATHDTGSAVLAVPSEEEHCLYISSGTWSLLGCERKTPDCSAAAREKNFTNEGGYGYRYRFLKNIMGLWMIQSVRNELSKKGEEHSFAELCDLAREERNDTFVDVSDGRFLSPQSMIKEVQEAVKEQGQPVPETAGALARVIYRSLAKCYAESIKELEAITGTEYEVLHIVGGGAKAGYLNELSAELTGKPVLAGEGESTAIGNLGAQLLADGVFPDVADLRRAIKTSFPVRKWVG